MNAFFLSSFLKGSNFLKIYPNILRITTHKNNLYHTKIPSLREIALPRIPVKLTKKMPACRTIYGFNLFDICMTILTLFY